MKTRLLLASALAIAIAGCDQKNAAVEELHRKNVDLESRLAEQERAAKLKDAEDLAARQAAANDEAASKLAADRAALEAEKAKLTEAEKAAAEEDFRRREAALRSEERRIADAREMSARKEAEAREAKVRAQPRDLRAAQPVSGGRTLDIFYDALDPYGDWLEVEGYGYVFEPRVSASRGWRPYTDGGWVHTDHGWAWKSNEPFGWATYHYGRWVRLNRRGWVWVPGSEWAPAWVSWRRNDDYIGWAPLPPEAYSARGFNSAVDQYYDIGAGSYVFVPQRNFCGGNSYVGRVVEPERNVFIIQQTINVTNISYRTVHQKTVIVNEGPDYAAVRAAASVPVPTLNIERFDARDSRDAAAATVGAGVLAVFAPNIVHGSQSKPKQVKARETRDVDRGWGGIAEDMRARMREKNAVEARQVEVRERAGLPAAPTVAVPAVAPVPVPATSPATPVVKPPVPAVNPRGGVSKLPVVKAVPAEVVPAPAPKLEPRTAPVPAPPPVNVPATQPSPEVVPPPPVAPPKPAPAPAPAVVAPPPTILQPEPLRPRMTVRGEAPARRAVTPPPAPALAPPPAPVVAPPPVPVATPRPAPVVAPRPLQVTRPVPVAQPPPPRQTGIPGRFARPTPTPTPTPKDVGPGGVRGRFGQ